MQKLWNPVDCPVCIRAFELADQPSQKAREKLTRLVRHLKEEIGSDNILAEGSKNFERSWFPAAPKKSESSKKRKISLSTTDSPSIQSQTVTVEVHAPLASPMRGIRYVEPHYSPISPAALPRSEGGNTSGAQLIEALPSSSNGTASIVEAIMAMNATLCKTIQDSNEKVNNNLTLLKGLVVEKRTPR